MRCNVCDVEINSRGKRCPICGNELHGKRKDFVYPSIKRKRNLPEKILLFISLVACLITGYIDYEVTHKFTWSIYVFLGVGTGYAMIYYLLNSYKDIFRKIGNVGFLVIVMLFIWYFVTGWKIIPNFIIPGLCIADLLFSDIVALIFKRHHIRKYLSVLVSNVLLALIPIILIMFNIIDFDYIAHISFLLSMINIFILVIFDFNDVKDELMMIFNY